VATPAKTVQPAKLSCTEKWLAGLLMVLGVGMLVVLLSAFMSRGQDWSLISKEVTEVTAATAEAGEKKTTTTEYSDSVLITGLGVGGLFILTGVFFGRIREIALPGGISMKLGELPPDKDKELKDSIEKKAKEKGATDEKAKALAEEARKQAGLVFQDEYWGAVPQPSSDDLERIADKSVERAEKIVLD